MLLQVLVISSCHTTAYRDLARNDLDFMVEQVTNNHPGVYNAQDPLFNDHLYKEYEHAKRRLKEALLEEECKEILLSFTRSFNDSHLRIELYDALKCVRMVHDSNFSIRELSSHVVWVTLPTFQLSSSEEKLFEEVIQRLPFYRNKAAIVFDLRGNRGGNSEYGDVVVESLFGKQYANAQQLNAKKNVYVEWRASVDNLAYLKGLCQLFKDKLRMQQSLQGVIKGMEESLRLHKPYYQEAEVAVGDNQIANPSNSVTAKIIVIIEHANGSAALDFIDALKIMEHPICLVGQTTSADRVYMEVRSVQLPSKTGFFTFPVKVYKNRLRGDNIPYEPDIFYAEDMMNTQKLEDFVLKQVIP